MFNCENSYAQQYQCCVNDNPHRHSENLKDKLICFDVCLGSELIYLWSNGIQTIGCCCGKHTDCYQGDMAYIQVEEKNIDEMLDMGYIIRYNHLLEVQNCFIPKTNLN